MKSVQQKKTNGTNAKTKSPAGPSIGQARPHFDHSGFEPGAKLADLIREQAAWIMLVREQLDHDGSVDQACTDLGEAASVLLRLSLEIAHVEHDAEESRKVAS